MGQLTAFFVVVAKIAVSVRKKRRNAVSVGVVSLRFRGIVIANGGFVVVIIINALSGGVETRKTAVLATGVVFGVNAGA